jgi:putative heme-binding domain-containing protein
MYRVAVLFFAGLLLLSAQHEPKEDKPKHRFIGDPKGIEAGRLLFSSGCAACHGNEGQGGRGPNLRERIYWHPVDEDVLYKVIQKGIPAGGMPAAALSEDQLWQVVAYVRSLTAPAIETVAPGDPSAGEKVFWGKAGCGGCHTIRGKGGKLGPDLTNAGATLPLPQIRQDILDPDAGGAAGYRSVSVVLRKGGTLQGVARNLTNYSLQLQDAQGNLHLLAMSEIQEMTLAKGSPMPKDYAKRLTSRELDDVLAYLSKQSARPIEPKTEKKPGETNQ